MNKAKLKILCVDDESDILDILAEQVKDLGFTPVSCTSPADAIAQVEAGIEYLSLIISDFRMPEMDGHQFRSRVLAKTKNIPFIILSGNISRDDALKALELKISGFLNKPATEDKIKEVILREMEPALLGLQEEKELAQCFVADSETLIEEMESLLLALESDSTNIDTINRIFAIAHTIKGSSGFIKPNIINKFTHKYEDFFSPYKKNGVTITPAVISVLLKGLDVIKGLIATLKAEGESYPPLEELLSVLVLSNAPVVEAREKKLKGDGAVTPITKSTSANEIKVSMQTLDQFMELSGEITVIRNMINKLVRSIEKSNAGNKEVQLLGELLTEMHKINANMQDRVVDLRKISAKSIFRPLHRAVRDLSGTLKKEIDFITDGEELRVDNSIAEALTNSLIHMIRNCVDHGVETPQERQAKNKIAKGTIKLSIKEKSDHVYITIQDDGKGINPEIIRKKVVEKQLFNKEQAATLSIKDLQMMIFESGFSTAAQITDVSGRGVGMDMVKKSIQKVGGHIDIKSEIDKGTTFQLVVPLPKSVTIINALFVRVKNEIFGLPQDNIFRLISISAADLKKAIRQTQGADFLLLGDQLYPLIYSGEVFEENPVHQTLDPFLESVDEIKIALLKTKEFVFAIIVDEIYDMEDSVVKSVAKQFKRLDLYLGATFLSDGQLGLILNPEGVGKRAGLKALTQEAGTTQSQVLTESTKTIITFMLSQETNYAVYLDDIFRLEIFKPDQIQYSGLQPTLIYREEIIPLYSIDGIFGYAPADEFCTKSDIPTLIIQRGGKFFGLVVNKILDLCQSGALDTVTSSREEILGSVIVDGKTITLINVAGFAKANQVANTSTNAPELKLAA